MDKCCVKITSKRQFERIIEIFEEDAGRGKSQFISNKQHMKVIWKTIATAVNSIGPPVRTAPEWQRVWTYYKSKLKKKVATKTKNDSNLNPLERRALNLMNLQRNVQRPLERVFNLESFDEESTQNVNETDENESEEELPSVAMVPRKKRSAKEDERQKLLENQNKSEKEGFYVYQSSGTYRINDNIEALKLRLYFRHINSLLKLPKFDFDLNKNVATRRTGEPQQQQLLTSDDDIHVVNIHWQQKILSASEMELYRDEKNCQSDAQRRYHEWLRNGGGAQVAMDDGQPSKEFEENEHQKSGKSKSKLKRSKKVDKLKQHEDVAADGQNQRQQFIFTYTNEDDHIPAVGIKEQRILKTHAPASVECMYVYAALQSNTLLIALRWHVADQILHIYPDFRDFHENPYFIQIDADYCHLYAYGFENISAKHHSVKPAAIDDCFSSNFLGLPPPHWQSEQQLTEEFAMPPKRCHRVVLLLEIRTAHDFEYDQLHVRYHTQLPAGTILEEGQLDSSTHTSSSGQSRNRLHHLGYSWQLTLLCEQDCIPTKDLCCIFFEVISIDSWQRERVEGFAYCSFKLQTAYAAAIRTEHLICLRPVESFTERLERYFIGGRKKFDYVSFFLGEPLPPSATNAKNEDQQTESEFHSRYGCRMQRTGELIVTCQQFTQRNCELLHPCAHRKSGMTLDDIMLAYRGARKRLEAIVYN